MYNNSLIYFSAFLWNVLSLKKIYILKPIVVTIPISKQFISVFKIVFPDIWMSSRSNRNTKSSSIVESIHKGISENERQQASKFSGT